MKLHRVSYTLDGQEFTEFTSSGAGAAKIRVRVKKLKADVTSSDEVDVDPGRTGLIAFLNQLTAHSSSKEG
jgi:hypothetical protein